MRIRALAVLGVVGLTLGVAPAYAVSSTPASAKASSSASLVAKAKKPSKPTGVTVASGTKSYSVSWKASVTHGSKVTSYQVADRHKTGKKWSSWKKKTVKASARTSTVSGTNGSSHQVKVRAHSKKGYSAYSSTKSVKIGLPGGVPGIVVTDGLKTTAKKIAVSWKTASSHGKAISGYKVYLRHKSGSSWSSYTVKSVASSARTYYFRGLASGTYQAAVRAVNKNGSGALSTPKGALLPQVAVTTPAPFTGGQTITVKVSNFPYDQGYVTVGVCAGGRVLSGPGDCATTASGGFKFPVNLSSGAATTTLKLPTGALGNSNGAAVTCGATHPGACIIDTTSVSEFFESAPYPIRYANPAVAVVQPGPYSVNDVLSLKISGFPAATTSVRAAMCRGDFDFSTGAGACSPQGASNKAVALKGGAATSTITLPHLLGNTGGAPANIDCTDAAGVGCAIVVFNADASQLAYKIPAYSHPYVTLSGSAPYAAGSTVTLTVSGFPAKTTSVRAATCRGDFDFSSGGGACSLQGVSNKAMTLSGGAGTTTLTLPHFLGNTGGTPTNIDCTDGAGVGCAVVVFNADASQLTYALPGTLTP